MPIIKSVSWDNGVTAAFHIPAQLRVDFQIGTVDLGFISWTNESAYAAQASPVASGFVSDVLLSDLGLQPDALLLTSEMFAGGVIVADTTAPLSLAKVRKDQEINTSRLKANQGTFVYAGHEIQCDKLSRGDIDGVCDEVALTGSLPAAFPGAWKTKVNTVWVPIPDVATWTLFVQAMVAQGSANFAHSQALKTLVAAATTVEEVDAVQWGMTIPQA